MAFSSSEREYIKAVAKRGFSNYCRVIHPVTFKEEELYRAAWPDEHWEALALLMREHGGAVSTGYYYRYRADFSKYSNRPKWLGKTPTLQFEFRGGQMPHKIVREEHVGEEVAMDMRRWILKAFHFRRMYRLLGDELDNLLDDQCHHDCDGQRILSRAVVNTPRILHRVWPEVASFMDAHCREEIRNSRIRAFALPKFWDEEILRQFRTQDGMEELNTALLAAGMVDYHADEYYPELVNM